MHPTNLAKKTAIAHNEVIAQAEKIAAHFGFTDEMDAIRAIVFSTSKAEIARMRQAEAIAALLARVASHLESIEPEPAEQTESDEKPARSKRNK